MSDFENHEFYQELGHVARLVFSEDIAEGLEACQSAAQKYPESGKVVCLLGVAANILGDQGQAAQLLDTAYNLEPNCQEIVNANAVVLARSGKLNDSLFFAKLATALEPDDIFSKLLPEYMSDYAAALQNVEAPMHGIFAMIEFEHGNYVECIHACERQLKTNSADWAAYVLMAQALVKLNAPQRAIGTIQMVIALSKELPVDTYTALGDAYLAIGDKSHAWMAYDQALRMTHGEDNRKNRVHVLSQQSSFGPRFDREFATCYAGYYASVDDEAEKLDLFGGGEDLDGRKIKVGILSDQFYDSAKAPYLELVLREYDRDCYELYGYQQNALKDSTTSRFANMVDGWREIEPIDPDTAAFMMASDGLDILIDTIGVSAQGVPDLIAQKPAPVIINWLSDGHGVTSKAVDFVLCSASQQPIVATMNGGAEALAVDGPALGFDGDALSILLQRASETPSAQNGFVTYGALLSPQHMNAEFIRQCAGVLAQDRESVLVFGVTGLGNTSYRNWIVEQFATFGVTDQIQIAELKSHGFDDLSGYLMGIDVFIAHTSAYNQRVGIAALLSGVPVLTPGGEYLETNILGEILTGMGKADWVVQPHQEMADVMANLLAQPKALEQLHSDLADLTLDSDVCDEDVFIESFEEALQQALQRKKLI